jgi:c-di-GMP-binding flagellar brake protein YcgR
MTSMLSGIRIGSLVSLTLQTPEGTREFRSRVEDIAEGLLTVAMPTVQGRPVVVPLGEQISLMIQTVSDAPLYVEAEVVGRQARPFPLLQLRPLRVQEHQQRSFYRVQVSITPEEVWWWRGPVAPGPITDELEPSPAALAGASHRASRVDTDGVSRLAAVPTAAALLATNERGVSGSIKEGEAHPPAGKEAGELGRPEGSEAVPLHAGAWVPLEAKIIDLSGGGVGLLAKRDLPPGTAVRLKFTLPIIGQKFDVRGRVVVSLPRHDGEEQCYKLGVKFESLSRQDQDRLVRANQLYQIEQRRRAIDL